LTKRSSFAIFQAVEKALFLREINTRISIGKMGLLWTFFEPFLQAFIFVGVHSYILKVSNYDYSVFMASGIVAFFMFKNIVDGSKGAFLANKGLFSYRQVKPIDTIVARTLVESFLSGVVVLIFLLYGYYFHYDIAAKNLLMVSFGYLWLIFFAFGFGLLVAVGNAFFASIGKFVTFFSFGLLVFSAIFYPVASLSPEIQKIILYNPLTHFMEMIHGYYLNELDDRFVDYQYMLLWTLSLWFAGMWLYLRLEKRIISQ
jgi:capsular polysaccharide transport system permease protein